MSVVPLVARVPRQGNGIGRCPCRLQFLLRAHRIFLVGRDGAFRKIKVEIRDARGDIIETTRSGIATHIPVGRPRPPGGPCRATTARPPSVPTRSSSWPNSHKTKTTSRSCTR